MTRAWKSGVIALVFLGACGPALVAVPPAAPRPTPSVPASAPPSAPAPSASGAPRFALPAVSPTARYGVRVRTALTRDSAGRTEQDVVESSARVELTLRRDARGSLRGTGRVDSFTVRASGASVRSASSVGPTPAPVPPLSNIMFDVLLDSAFVRTSVRPALANECDSPEAAAASMARDLLIRVPPNVVVGTRWRDSVVAFVCRGGVPITMRTTVESTLSGTSDGDRRLRIRRTIDTRLEGISRSPWRQVEIGGEGSGTQDVQLDVATGSIVELDGESTLMLRVANGSLRDAARVQRVVQKSTVQVRPVRP